MALIGVDIGEAACHLRGGSLVAIPTETVYGLAANGLDGRAVAGIFAAKNRPRFDPLILHCDSVARARELVEDFPPAAAALADAFWPGPLTLLLEKKALVPEIVTAALPRVALRVPAHPHALSLLSMLDFPLAAPSANPFGYVSPTTAQHVEEQLGDAIPYILDGGRCRVGVESTIVGFEQGETVVYRLGGVGLEELESVAGPLRLHLNQSSNPAAPGMIRSHYAPRKPLLLGEIPRLLEANRTRRVAVLAFRERYRQGQPSIALSPRGSLEEAAANLFAALRELDQSQADLIVGEALPEEGLGRAINDRLRRAAAR